MSHYHHCVTATLQFAMSIQKQWLYDVGHYDCLKQSERFSISRDHIAFQRARSPSNRVSMRGAYKF